MCDAVTAGPRTVRQGREEPSSSASPIGEFFGVDFGETVGPDGQVLSRDEWVAKYGFSISTFAFSQAMVGENLVGHNFDANDEGAADPNEEYVASLTDAERDAYLDALYGSGGGPHANADMTEEEMDATVEAASQEASGCQSKALDAVFGADMEEAFGVEFGSELEALFDVIESHPRIVGAEQKTASCVADKGFEYTNMETVYETFGARVAQLREDAAEIEPSSTEPELSDEAKATLGEIQADEIALAIAVKDCGGNVGSFGESELPALLIEAVRAAARGDALISPSITVRLLQELAASPRRGPLPQPVVPLSEREEQVLRLVAVGRSNNEIADGLYIGVATVKTHLMNMSTKVGVRNRVELAAWAWETGRMHSR